MKGSWARRGVTASRFPYSWGSSPFLSLGHQPQASIFATVTLPAEQLPFVTHRWKTNTPRPLSAKERRVVRKFKGVDVQKVEFRLTKEWKEAPPETQVSLHKRIRRKAKLHMIFPDVLPSNDLFTPLFPLKVVYKTGVPVRKGTFISPSLVQDKPDIEFKPNQKGKFWTLLMTSPDDPLGDKLPPSKGGTRGTEFLHWLVVNIPEGNVAQGETLCTYFPATPKQQNEQGHRYVFLVFEQKDGKMTFDKALNINNDMARYNFNTLRLKDEYNLVPSSLAFFKSAADGTRLTPSYTNLGIPQAPQPWNPLRISPYTEVTRW